MAYSFPFLALVFFWNGDYGRGMAGSYDNKHVFFIWLLADCSARLINFKKTRSGGLSYWLPKIFINKSGRIILNSLRKNELMLPSRMGNFSFA